MRQIVVILLLWILWLPSAAAEVKRLAVLEFTGVGIDGVILGVISDSARTGIVQVVDTDEILVMTKESILEVLKDMGKDISCMEGACEVETGRNIGADYIMTGAVVRIDDDYVLTLKFFDTQSSALLASETMDAKSVNNLRKATPDLAQKVVRKGLKLPAKKPAQIIAETPRRDLPQKQEGKSYNAVLIPRGAFLMGCTAEQGKFCQGSEKPAHEVQISRDFYMMESEVTQKFYKEVMGENPSPAAAKRKFFPVTRIKWHEAAEFANELSRIEGLEPCYVISRRKVRWADKDCRGWRLPTEAECEYAARAGNQHKYAGSNWFRKVAHGGVFATTPIAVCSKNKNGYGLCDMSGNVQEWTWDKYRSGTYRRDLAKNIEQDPTGPQRGIGHVTRGGGIKKSRFDARISRRAYAFSSLRYPVVGFRLVRNR